MAARLNHSSNEHASNRPLDRFRDTTQPSVMLIETRLAADIWTQPPPPVPVSARQEVAMNQYDPVNYYQTAVTTFLVLSVLFAAILHRVLKRSGRIFLDELFRNHPAAGTALTRLLDIGYVLFNVGYMALAASLFSTRSYGHDGVRAVAAALGVQMLLLAKAHGINVWLFSRKVGRAMRNNEREIEELLRT
jgi:hypothetical protein